MKCESKLSEVLDGVMILVARLVVHVFGLATHQTFIMHHAEHLFKSQLRISGLDHSSAKMKKEGDRAPNSASDFGEQSEYNQGMFMYIYVTK